MASQARSRYRGCVVRHEANVPSGGKRTDIDIGDFLSSGQRNPEHQALLRLIGTLVENKPETARH